MFGFVSSGGASMLPYIAELPTLTHRSIAAVRPIFTNNAYQGNSSGPCKAGIGAMRPAGRASDVLPGKERGGQ